MTLKITRTNMKMKNNNELFKLVIPSVIILRVLLTSNPTTKAIKKINDILRKDILNESKK